MNSVWYPQLALAVLLAGSVPACTSQEGRTNSPKDDAQEASQATAVSSSDAPAPQPPEAAGLLFGQPVPMDNYHFAMQVAGRFGTPWGGVPNTVERLDERTWEELLLSFEAFRRGIEVSREETEQEIAHTLKGHGVSFNWQEDHEAYAQWVRETLGEEVLLFENQMTHLVQLKRLHQQVLDSIEPSVSEEEAFQEYLNEYNTLSVELAQFETLEEADAFYRKVQQDPAVWDEEVAKDEGKERNDQVFRKPGFVALEFLMDMWKFPKDAVYEMIEMDVDSIHPPAPIYKGYGVFKVLQIRRAVPEEFEKRRASYDDQIRTKKKYEGFYHWFENLKRDANIVKYAKPPEGILKQASP